MYWDQACDPVCSCDCVFWGCTGIRHVILCIYVYEYTCGQDTRDSRAHVIVLLQGMGYYYTLTPDPMSEHTFVLLILLLSMWND